MLDNMYLVSAEMFSREDLKNLHILLRPAPHPKKNSQHPPPSKKKNKTRKREKQHPCIKWVKTRKKMGLADITRKTRMKAIAEFLQKVLPEPASPRTETVVKKKKQPPLLPS